METSLSVFQDRLIDYAGLFPPANLSLDTAIHNYAQYKNSKDSWMLGPFILPVAQLYQLDIHMHLFSSENPLSLSVVGRRSSSVTECKTQFQNDLNDIVDFVQQYGEKVKVEMHEIPLPSEVPNLDLLDEIAKGASKLQVSAFCEVQFIGDWKKHVTESLDVIAAHNSANSSKIGTKLRTGGIRAEMFPALEQVAYVMEARRNRNLPIKFTAGLHHPVRMYREEVQTKMYGFLNIFLAGILAEAHQLEAKRIEEILADEDSSSFSFSKDHISWRDLSVTTQQIKQLRKTSLLSFGSCSFDESRDELKELINQQGVTI